MLDEIQAGVWVIKLGRFIPDNEKWLHSPAVQVELKAAIAWAEENPPQPVVITSRSQFGLSLGTKVAPHLLSKGDF